MATSKNHRKDPHPEQTLKHQGREVCKAPKFPWQQKDSEQEGRGHGRGENQSLEMRPLGVPLDTEPQLALGKALSDT